MCIGAGPSPQHWRAVAAVPSAEALSMTTTSHLIFVLKRWRFR
jgi:hypothetical protein